jgi:CcmD family protein
MLYFTVAYLSVWIATVSYLAWLGSNQRRLERSLESLEARARCTAEAQPPKPLAA